LGFFDANIFSLHNESMKTPQLTIATRTRPDFQNMVIGTSAAAR
jgi:hypothetical protein